MSIARKGSRRIIVGGTRYDWRIRKQPTYSQALTDSPMLLAIQASEEGPRRVLVVDLCVSRPDNWLSPHATRITPAMVRDIIEKALAAGWTPRSGGAPLRFEYGVAREPVGSVQSRTDN